MQPPVEFLGEAAEPDESADAEQPARSRRWVAAAAVAVVLLAGLAVVRHEHARPTPRKASAASASVTASAHAAPRPLTGPVGCPGSAFCDISHELAPALLGAVRKDFPDARVLSSYSVIRSGPHTHGGLQYRQVALSVGSALLLVSVTARPSPPPYPSLDLNQHGSGAWVRVSATHYDVEVRFAGFAAKTPPTPRMLVLAQRSILTSAG